VGGTDGSLTKRNVMLKLNTNLSGTTNSLLSGSSIKDLSARTTSLTSMIPSHSGSSSVKHALPNASIPITTAMHHSSYHTAHSSATRNL
jgi:hypothetical protein